MAQYKGSGTVVAGTIIDGTGLTTTIPLLIKDGKNLTGVEVQGVGSAAPGFLLRNSSGVQKGAFGVAVASNDWTFNSLADDAVLVTPGTLWLAGSTAGGVKIHNASGNATAVFNDTVGVVIGWSSCNVQIASTGITVSHPANSGQQITFNQGNNIATAGDSPYLVASSTFAPTSGTATYEMGKLSYTLNQTGGANGTCTGLLITATETAVVGTHDILNLKIGANSKFRVGGVAAGAAQTGIAYFGATGGVQQTSGANLTNSVTSGGVNDTITDWTNLATYSTDAAAIRNAVYQLARKLKQVNDALRVYGLLT